MRTGRRIAGRSRTARPLRGRGRQQLEASRRRNQVCPRNLISRSNWPRLLFWTGDTIPEIAFVILIRAARPDYVFGAGGQS
jgi:hypothetical protein